MLKKKCSYLAVALLITGAIVMFVAADTGHNYSETYVNKGKVDARLQSWIDRALSHADDLEKSDHLQIVKWRKQMETIDFTDEKIGIRTLNTLINNDVRYVDDYTHFHKKDFWADPVTALEEGGDCEDIALLKAASLYRLQWPKDRMHLLIGFLLERGKPESHAVLLVEAANGEQFVLRSITDQVVLPDQFAFEPIYAVDGNGTIIVKSKRSKMEL